jgi:hypothetical protein
MTCLFCNQPRHEQRLDCGSAECVAKVNAMTTDELFAIRERECLEAWRANPPPADGRGTYIHLNFRDPQ